MTNETSNLLIIETIKNFFMSETIKVPNDSTAEQIYEEIKKIGRHFPIFLHRDLMEKLFLVCLRFAPCKGDRSVLYYFKNKNGEFFAIETDNLLESESTWFQVTATYKRPFYTYQSLSGKEYKIMLES